eukprot:Pompholyxophrys_sp_v1_NODE_1_length_32789_cov_6.460653.p34 type:complete len:106 gc:universal NODE_1_length_32789_cov_6.460653:9278-9595(+)
MTSISLFFSMYCSIRALLALSCFSPRESHQPGVSIQIKSTPFLVNLYSFMVVVSDSSPKPLIRAPSNSFLLILEIRQARLVFPFCVAPIIRILIVFLDFPLTRVK